MATVIVTQRNAVFCKGNGIFHRSTEGNEVLIVAREDVLDAESTVSADMFSQDRDDILHFSRRCTKHAVSLDAFLATSIMIEVHCPVGDEGTTLTEDQFDELQTIGQDISELVPHEIITQDTNGNNGDSDSDNILTEQICRTHRPPNTSGS